MVGGGATLTVGPEVPVPGDTHPISRVPTTRRWLVVMNDKAGTAARGKVGSDDPKADLTRRLHPFGITCDFLGDLAQLESKLDSSRYDAVLAGGGDGTVSSIAGVLAKRAADTSLDDAPALGVLPLGTFNHFAQSIHLPLDFKQAITALATASLSPHDAGYVTGADAPKRLFLNVVTLGLHPAMVKDRDAQLKKKPQGKLLGKWPAMLAASWRTLRRFPRHKLHIKTPESEMTVRTPGIYVCRDCNKLQTFGFGPDAASKIPAHGAANPEAPPAHEPDHDGSPTFSILVGKTQTRVGSLWIAFRAALGKLPNADGYDLLHAATCTITSAHAHHLDLAVDGEALRVTTPVRFELHPNALRVLIPAQAPMRENLP